MRPRFSRYLGITLLTVGIIGVAVTGLNNDSGFLADPEYYPERPGGPPWSSDFGPYGPPQGWQDPQEIPQMPPVPGPYYPGQNPSNGEVPQDSYSSNGESIYFTLITSEGKPILAQARNVSRMHGDLSCGGCHGSSGQGGYLEMGRWSTIVPSIDNDTLRRDNGGGEMLRPAYTDETLGKAITRGVNSAGKVLDTSMPRFQLQGKNLDDLIAFLKTLRNSG